MINYRLWAVLAISVLMLACVKTEVQSWQVVEDANVDTAYTKPDVDFSAYTRLMAAPFEIYYPQTMEAPDPDDLERIRGIYRQAFLDEIGDDYDIVSEPGVDVLKVRFSLLDLRINKPDAQYTPPSRLTDFVHSGHQTLLMELLDSETDEVLARAADEERPDNVSVSEDYDDWDAVEFTAARWAALFRDFLDRNLTRVQPE